MMPPLADFASFFEDGFEAIFEFAPELRAGDQSAHVERDEAFVLKAFGDITFENTLREPFHDGGFAHARFADEDGIVFGAPGEDLHAAADFLIAADDGIEFSLAGGFDEIAAIFFEGLEFVLRVLISDAGVATNFLEGGEDGVASDAHAGEDFLGGGGDACEGEQEVLGGEVFDKSLRLRVRASFLGTAATRLPGDRGTCRAGRTCPVMEGRRRSSDWVMEAMRSASAPSLLRSGRTIPSLSCMRLPRRWRELISLWWQLGGGGLGGWWSASMGFDREFV